MKPNKKIFDLWKAINLMRDKTKSLFIKELWLSSMGLTYEEVEYFVETFMEYNPKTKHKIVNPPSR
jgi:hypothetical protein